MARSRFVKAVAAALAVLGLLLGHGAACAQQFSADLIAEREGMQIRAGRLRVSGDDIRIEAAELADGFFLINAAAPTAYFVRPAAGIFMDARQSSPLVRMFVTVDPDDPCRRWQAMAVLAGLAGEGDWRCVPASEPAIGEQPTAGYRALSAAGEEVVGWIDRRRRFPLRVKGKDGGVFAVTNLHDEPQPARSFEMPAGLRKFDPTTLIERIKQSDVWVAAPTPAR